MTGESTYEHCIIETHGGGILHVICSDTEKKEKLISLIGGTQKDGGISVLDGVDTKEHLKEYKKMVDVIDIEKIDSTLTVKNYIVFYAMVTGIYSDKTIDKLTELLLQNGMENVLDMPVNALSDMEKIKVRCLAAYMKHISCLVGKGLLDCLEQMQKDTFYDFLREYFIQNQCMCLLFDNMQCQENEFGKVVIV